MEIEVKGKTYKVQTGAKGGQYYINDKGKKVYIKEKDDKKSSSTPKEKKGTMRKRYTANIAEYNDKGELINDWNEWHDCYTAQQARIYFTNAHPNCEVTLTGWQLV